MMPSMQNPNEPVQMEEVVVDAPCAEIDTSEDVVTQSPDIGCLIGALSEPYRTSLHMRKVEGKSYQEIADYLGVAIGTVKSHVSRGMKMLGKRMDVDEVDGLAGREELEDELVSIEHAVEQKQVPEPYRKFLRLRYVEKQTYAAIATSFQCPVGTVKSYISRGKKFLSGM